MKETGQEIVMTDFNPSDNPNIARIKEKAAELIDLIEDIHTIHTWPRIERIRKNAIDRIEEGAMWGVKCAAKAEKENAEVEKAMKEHELRLRNRSTHNDND